MAAIAQMSHCTGPNRIGAGTSGDGDIGNGQAITLIQRSGLRRTPNNAVDDLDEGVQLAGDLVHGDGQRCEFLVGALECFVGALLRLGEQDLSGEEHFVFLAELDVVIHQKLEDALDAVEAGCSIVFGHRL